MYADNVGILQCALVSTWGITKLRPDGIVSMLVGFMQREAATTVEKKLPV
jgi:hypothetical protein